MRIVLASPHDSFRRALRLLLQFKSGFDVVGEAKDGQELVSEINNSNPDLVLLDDHIIDQPDVELTAILHNLDPLLSVIVFSENTARAQAALNTGATAFVLKGETPNRLFVAIENIRLKDKDEQRTHYHDFFQPG